MQKGIKRILFKNALIAAFLVGVSISGFAGSGLFDAYAILSINGGENTYRQYSSFQGWSIGSFTYGTNDLILNGAQNKTFKNGGSDVTGGQLAYRVYLTGGTEPPFRFIYLPFDEDYPVPPATAGDQKWETNNENINLLSGRSPGNYTLEVYWQAYSSDGNHFYSNSGNNFKATFIITCNTPTLGTYSATSLVSGANTTITPSAAPTNTTSLVAFTNTNFTGVLSADPATGVVRVTDAKQAGIYPVTVKATGSGGCTATATFNLTVNNPACSQGQFVSATYTAPDLALKSVSVGDFNGDGNQDMAIATGKVSIFLGNGAGSFGSATNFGGLEETQPVFIAVGDFNGDGKQDLATTNSLGSDKVSVLLGDGTGAFGAPTVFQLVNTARSLAVGDFNGDGKQDIATTHEVTRNNVSILLGNGDGSFGSATTFSATNSPFFIVVGDFNADGNQDLATANRGSNSVSILLGNGAGSFGAASIFPVGNHTYSLAVGDFNGDGKQDLATANYVSNNVSILIGNGVGSFASAVNFPVGDAPNSISVGDFNGDGKQDLTTANSNSNNVSILLGDGLGSFGAATNLLVGDIPSTVGVGDFNGDGKQDLATVEHFGTQYFILLGDGDLVWYLDADNDNYYTGPGVTQCTSPGTGYKTSGLLGGGDCNDNNVQEYPGKVWVKNADGDGWGDGTVTQCEYPGAAYTIPEGVIDNSGDCNDNNASIYPGATEVCDGVDNNCDGSIDEGCPTGIITGPASVSCFNDFTAKLTVSFSGGTAPYTYLWNTGKSGSVLTGAGAGTYTCTITDAGGQIFFASHTITQPAAVTGTLVVTGIKCLDPNKGSIVVTASGGTPGYTYALNYGSFGVSNTFSTLNAGKYTVNIKDANGCQGRIFATVRQLSSGMTLAAVRVGVTRCGAATGSITATAGNGLEPYQYQLGTGGFQSGGSFTGLTAGTYTVTAKDAVGCTITRSYTVPDNGSDAYEANNTAGASKTIALNENVVARIGTATDVDWFRFVTSAGTNYDITISHPSVTYTVRLFTTAGVEIIPAGSTPGVKTFTGLLPNTSYRIQVTGAQSFVCYNLWVTPTAPPTGTEMLTSKAFDGEGAAGLKAQPFPNPHNGSFMLQVESPVAGKGSIILYDLQGRTIVTRKENLRAGTNQVRFSNLQPIHYFYRVLVGDKATSGKVFKQ